MSREIHSLKGRPGGKFFPPGIPADRAAKESARHRLGGVRVDRGDVAAICVELAVAGDYPQARRGNRQWWKLFGIRQHGVGLLGRAAVAGWRIHHDRGIVPLLHVSLTGVRAGLRHNMPRPRAIPAHSLKHRGVAGGVGDNLLLRAVGQKHDHLGISHRLATGQELEADRTRIARGHDLCGRFLPDPGCRPERVAEASLRMIHDEKRLGSVFHDSVRERAMNRTPQICGQLHKPRRTVAGQFESALSTGPVAGDELDAVHEFRVDVFVDLERLAENHRGLCSLLVRNNKHEMAAGGGHDRREQ